MVLSVTHEGNANCGCKITPISHSHRILLASQIDHHFSPSLIQGSHETKKPVDLQGTPSCYSHLFTFFKG